MRKTFLFLSLYLSFPGSLYAKTVDIKINTYPSGADITLSSHDKRHSVQGQGSTIFKLPPGDYQLVVNAKGFIPYEEEVEAKDEYEINVKLKPHYSPFNLNVEPEDARVEVNGKVMNERPLKLQVEVLHKFKVSHPDYDSEEFEFIPQFAAKTERDVYLEPKKSYLTFIIHPQPATVEVDGRIFSSNGKIPVDAGQRHIRISSPSFFDYEEKIEIEPNRHYPVRTIYLKDNSKDISPSDKRVTFRFEYNPLTQYGQFGRVHLIPVALHLEWYYISLGFGVNQNTDSEEKDDPNGMKLKREKNFSDIYGTLRLITPRFGSFKYYAAYTNGETSTGVKGFEDKEPIKNTKVYYGYGLGTRGYLSPRWSIHLEIYQVKTKDKKLKTEEKSLRGLLGVGYEF